MLREYLEDRARRAVQNGDFEAKRLEAAEVRHGACSCSPFGEPLLQLYAEAYSCSPGVEPLLQAVR